MENFPIFMRLRGQPCLVVGAGSVALRKIRLLRKAGAEVTVIAPAIEKELRSEFGGDLHYVQRNFRDSDISDYRLIVAATNSRSVNQRVSELSQAKNIPVNVVDDPELCSFITPSIVDRSPVVIGISTGGSAPVLARILRSKLEAFIPASYGKLGAVMDGYRRRVKESLKTERQRRRFWERIVQGIAAEHIFAGRIEAGKSAIDQELDQASSTVKELGDVALIGAGPGDPDLLTFRALRLMQQADVVLYDRLVSDEILNLTRRDADRIYVGKKRAAHAVEQTAINQMLVDLASQGKSVVRLKGGDPFIFGRGGEELDKLADNGIPFQVVPGITAASGCSTYAGIPLTHRDHAQSCVFVTGHLKNGQVNLDWQTLAKPEQTLVIYMGLVGLPNICEKLIENGLRESTPVALVERGTTSDQQVYVATLATICGDIEGQDIHAPTLIIVGSVVQLHQKLNWFDNTSTRLST